MTYDLIKTILLVSIIASFLNQALIHSWALEGIYQTPLSVGLFLNGSGRHPDTTTDHNNRHFQTGGSLLFRSDNHLWTNMPHVRNLSSCALNYAEYTPLGRESCRLLLHAFPARMHHMQPGSKMTKSTHSLSIPQTDPPREQGRPGAREAFI